MIVSLVRPMCPQPDTGLSLWYVESGTTARVMVSCQPGFGERERYTEYRHQTPDSRQPSHAAASLIAHCEWRKGGTNGPPNLFLTTRINVWFLEFIYIVCIFHLLAGSCSAIVSGSTSVSSNIFQNKLEFRHISWICTSCAPSLQIDFFDQKILKIKLLMKCFQTFYSD